MSEHGRRIAALVREHGWCAGVELGVHKAESSWDMLAANPALLLTGVDLWRPYGGSRKDKRTGGVPRHTVVFMRECLEEATLTAARFPGRFQILIEDTTAAADLFNDGQFDFVFIDGDHTTAKVEADTRAWMPKLRPGGAVLWHDIDWPSVQRAIRNLDLRHVEVGGNLGMWTKP